jgi:hypothetical protein
MSLSDVENAIKDAEALKFYDPQKKENAALREEVKLLKTEESEIRMRYEDRITSLESIIAEQGSVRITYKREHYTPEQFDKLVAARVERECRAMINKEVNERWAAEAPRLVREAAKREILSYPESCQPETRKAIEAQGAKHAENILRYRYAWPSWFQTIYQQEVNLGVQKGLDKTFWDNVNQRTTKEITRRENIAWPLFVQQHITPKFQNCLRSQLTKLSETMKIRCDKCGMEYDYTPTPEEIAALIREPRIFYHCQNPDCRDFLFPHNFPVSLGGIIYNLTTIHNSQ